MFADGRGSTEIAKELRVSVRSVQRWRRAWQEAGEDGVRSRGPVSRPKLSDALFAVLEEELAKGPVAHGWPDQRWTLARIKTLIGRRFHKSMTLSGISQMLRRHGWSHQVPARRVIERDEKAVVSWVRTCGHTWNHRGGARGLARLRGRSRILDDAADLPHLGKRGTTPVIRVRGRSQRRFSIAALCCHKPGERSRLIYRPRRHTDHKSGGRKSFAWTEYRDLLIAAHQQLGGPIVLIWDNLNVHKDRRMRAFIDTHDWITAYHLPPYTPDLNPVEGIWSILRRTSQANTAFTNSDHLISRLRHGLRQIQYRSDIIDGCLTATGLTLTTPRLQTQ
ncbi:IS630 family transposase [Streptomyces sp. 135]|uniref:IS630 family transposase n=1 Tax=Streptomyces sp. 135 TaxID=2838850 RepID=UPI0021DB5E88|nr:IS630 family transposase [Streptomyces sp. 135]